MKQQITLFIHHRFIIPFCTLLILMILPGINPTRAQGPSHEEIKASSCFLRTYEAADIPALERGMVTEIMFIPGEIVKASTVLAVLDDAESRLQVGMAKVNLERAQRHLNDSYSLQIAGAKVKETKQLIEKSKIEHQIVQKTSQSSVAIRQAKKSLGASQAELDRALAARKEFEGSVSDAKMSQLTFLRDFSQLEIESAEENQSVAKMQVGVEEATVATADAVLERLLFEQSQVRTDHSMELIEYEGLKLQLKLAETQLLRRKIASPFTGMLVEQYHHRGEWLEPGEPIFRIVRLDRLIVEGYADSNKIHHGMHGVKVRVVSRTDKTSTQVEGTLTFVSPEIDPVNQQVHIRAIIDNTDGKLRSGQAVDLTILLP